MVVMSFSSLGPDNHLRPPGGRSIIAVSLFLFIFSHKFLKLLQYLGGDINYTVDDGIAVDRQQANLLLPYHQETNWLDGNAGTTAAAEGQRFTVSSAVFLGRFIFAAAGDKTNRNPGYGNYYMAVRGFYGFADYGIDIYHIFDAFHCRLHQSLYGMLGQLLPLLISRASFNTSHRDCRQALII